MQTIYIDVLILLNMIIDFFLLQITSLLLKTSPSKIRLTISTVLGGIYSLLILAPELNVFLSLLIKIIMFASIVFIMYKPKSIRYFIKTFAVFTGVNLLFAGLLTGINMFISPSLLQLKNGIVYYDFGFITLIISVVIGYGVTLLINIISPKYSADTVFNIKITGAKSTAECKALMDTGNTVTDPFSGEPIILADLYIAEKTADTEIYDFIKNFTSGTNSIPPKGIRLIPVSTATGKSLIPVYKTIKITVICNGRLSEIENAEIGIADCFTDCNYSVLLNPFIIKESRHIKK